MPNVGTLGATTFANANILSNATPVLATAATIAPASLLTRITGAGAVANITIPDPYFIGPLFIYSTDGTAPTWVATGNIAIAGTFTANKVIGFLYDGTAGKWYPTNVA